MAEHPSAESRRFDRAATYYDSTRGLPHGTMADVATLLTRQLDGRGRCLEIGVGTGRIALPLHDAGIAMAGIDLSRPMMEVLIGKIGGRGPFPLAEADATMLPFPDASFGAGLVSHVLHLIPLWTTALDELFRVVEPGGVVLTSRGSLSSGSLMPEVRRRFEAAAGAGARHVGLSTRNGELERAMAERGAVETELPVITFSRDRTIGEMIDQLEAGTWSSTWALPDDVVHAAAAETRAWAAAQIGPLDQPRSIRTEITWKRFDLPSA